MSCPRTAFENAMVTNVADLKREWRSDITRRISRGEDPARYFQSWMRADGGEAEFERMMRSRTVSPTSLRSAPSTAAVRSATLSRATRTAAALAAIAASRAAQTRIENYVRVMKATPNRGYFDARPTDGIKKAVDLYFSK